MPITIIHCWSAPRSRSTALLYSFEAREDCVALDEPLYRRWLLEKIGGGTGNYGISRPYAKPFLEGVAPLENADEGEAWRWEREKACFNERIFTAVSSLVKNGETDGGCIFLKQMAKFAHCFDFESNWESDGPGTDSWKDKCLKLAADNEVELKHKHVLLVRDPVSVLGSWMGKSGDVHGNNPYPDEIGITQLLDVYSKVLGASMGREDGEEAVTVIDSDDLAADPPQSLQELCCALGIGYSESMLKWEAGPHKCDGPWAKWW